MRNKYGFLLLSAMLGACGQVDRGGTDTGNGYEVALTISAAPTPSNALVRATPTLTAAWLAVREIEFRNCDHTDRSKVAFDGPYFVNLMEGLSVDSAVLDEASYCRLRIRFHKTKSDEAPAALAGASVALEGTTAAGTPFVIRGQRSDTVDIDGDGDALQFNHGLNPLDLQFNLADWLLRLNIDSGTPNASGVVLIDNDHNRDLLQAFDRNVHQAVRLARRAK